MTLNAAVILAEGAPDGDSFSFDLDFNDVVLREKTVIKVERHADCALFRQLRMAAGKADPPDEDDIFDVFIQLDFNEVFRKKKDYLNPLFVLLSGLGPEAMEAQISARGEALMKNGFRLRLKGKGEQDAKLFYAFDKSASMSRKGLISFISEDLYDDADERVRLGLDFSEIEAAPSKYYAYRGLYLSNGRLIKGLKLDQNTVIVIDDDKMKVSADIVTCDLRYDADRNLLLNSEGKLPLTNEDGSLTVKNDILEINSFDGEGIISAAYAEIINKELFEKGWAYSFQVRMPFVKGVLHKVDFKKFVMEQLGLKSLNGVSIRDCFGKDRKLSDAQIILTRSMFKGKEWIEKAAESLSEEDQMKLYFERFNNYKHAMYISNTSRGYGSDDRVPLNYQFLNTMDISTDELMDLAGKHYREASAITDDPDAARRVQLRRADPSAVDDESFDEEAFSLPPWKYALIRNPAFIHDIYINGTMLKGLAESMRGSARFGRINASGTMGFLSGDLLAFMMHLLGQLSGADTGDAVKKLESLRMGEDRFYMPGHDRQGLRGDKYYGMLRSPHLSRNEQCALRPICPPKTSIYERYFGDLIGVIMTAYGSVVPAALGGADFDGDLVKLFTDDIVNAAILRGAYTEDEEGKRIRKYPIADIPKPPGKSKRLTSGKGSLIDFDTIEKTFSNDIGRISNDSLMIAKSEYVDKNSDYENWSALCTIATGLEIDAVKTGVRPDLRALEKKRGNARDDFIKNKSVEKKLKKGLKTDTDWTYDFVSPEDEGQRPIDYLEFFYQAEEAVKKDMPGRTVLQRLYRNARPLMWADSTPETGTDEEVQEKIKELNLIKYAYVEFSDRRQDVEDIKKSVDNDTCISKIMYLLNTEYDSEVDKLPRSGESIDRGINLAIAEFEKQFASRQDIHDASVRLRKKWEKWIFAGGYDNKQRVLSEILDVGSLSEPAKEILCDTYDNGYQILKHVIRYIEYSRAAEEGYLTSVEALKSKDHSVSDKVKSHGGYKTELLDKLCDAYDPGESSEEWKKTAKELCREEIAKLFDGDMTRAAEFVLQNEDAVDPDHKSFWNWFETEEIAELIAGATENDVEAMNA